MADKTERRLTRDLMLEAVPCRKKSESAGRSLLSVANQEEINIRILPPTSLRRERFDPWGAIFTSQRSGRAEINSRWKRIRIMSEIMEVPFPRADSSRLINFLTFQISMFFSTSFACCCCSCLELMVGEAKVICNQKREYLRPCLTTPGGSRWGEGPEGTKT